MRLNVYVPDELAASVKGRLPDLNVSALLQAALRDALGCDHAELVCSSCASGFDRRRYRDEQLSDFYSALLWALDPLARRGATVEGACRVVKDIGERHQISAASRLPLPRPSRAERARQRVLDFPDMPAPVRAVPEKQTADVQPKEHLA